MSNSSRGDFYSKYDYLWPSLENYPLRLQQVDTVYFSIQMFKFENPSGYGDGLKFHEMNEYANYVVMEQETNFITCSLVRKEKF